MYQAFKAFDRVKWIKDIHIQHNHWVFGKRKRDEVANRMLSDNNDKISDELWHSLKPERIKDIKTISKYLNIEPNWNVVDC